MDDPSAKPRVLLSILKGSCFNEHPGDGLFTTITAGFGRFECDKLLKPSGVELMNLPQSANIEISVFRRLSSHKELLCHNLVPISAVQSGPDPSAGGIWEGWLGLLGPETRLKSEETDVLFQHGIELGASSVRHPRLFIRMQYLPPGVPTSAAGSAPAAARAAVTPPTGSRWAQEGRSSLLPPTARDVHRQLAAEQAPSSLMTRSVPAAVMRARPSVSSMDEASNGPQAIRWPSPLAGQGTSSAPSRSVSGSLTSASYVAPGGRGDSSSLPSAVATQDRIGVQPSGVTTPASAIVSATTASSVERGQRAEDLARHMENSKTHWNSERAALESAVGKAVHGNNRIKWPLDSSGAPSEDSEAAASADLESLKRRLVQLEIVAHEMREANAQRAAAEHAFLNQLVPVLGKLGHPLDISSEDVLASPASARQAFAELTDALLAALHQRAAPSSVDDELSTLNAALRAVLDNIAVSSSPDKAEEVLRKLDVSARAKLEASGLTDSLQDLLALSLDSPLDQDGGLEKQEPGSLYKPDKDDPIDCLLAAKLLRVGRASPLTFGSFVRLRRGLYNFRGRHISCYLDGVGRLLVRRAASGGTSSASASEQHREEMQPGGSGELELDAFLAHEAAAASGEDASATSAAAGGGAGWMET
eukprot:TRINITY_DN64950_c0_g1_i1.p1 TRINITY_DN64950_c0_g1~~TRINITY_DN64950_c0_g1_i1.p1  ORF type:complete len:648 (-),score=92.20 TRINITY_DN64950_c0_g1_i1:17-1960(-)